jgi:trehalose 6-phosphate synthase
VPEYAELDRMSDEVAGRLNAQLGEFDWTPIRVVKKAYSRTALAGFYRRAQVGLVTPMRDGMNLVAKEYVAAQDPADPGVLVLSRFAGAAQQMGEALIVNPYDTHEVAEAIRTALAMPKSERIRRFEQLYHVIETTDIDWWRRRYLEALTGVPLSTGAVEPPRKTGTRTKGDSATRRASRAKGAAVPGRTDTKSRAVAAGHKASPHPGDAGHSTPVR